MKIFWLVSLFFFLGCSSVPSEEPLITLDPPEEAAVIDLVEPIENSAADIVVETSQSIEEEDSLRGEDSYLSLKTFLEGPFIGEEFTVGDLRKDWGTHKTYYATYKSDGLKISSTFHVPEGEGPFPVLILNHGYFPQETYKNGYGFGREQKYFAQKGYAVLHIDYRGYSFSDKDPEAYTGRRFGYTGYSADAVNAVVALKAAGLPYLDMDRVGMFGHSMGGGVTFNASLARPDLIKASVVWGPVSAKYEDNYLKWTSGRMTPEATEVFESQFGPLEDPDSFRALSPYEYLDRLEVPLLIQHGTADESCPVEWSRVLVDRLQDLGKDYEYLEYEGAPHVLWYDYWDMAVLDASLFFEKHLLR